MSARLNNPNHPSTQNAIRTSLNRLWLAPLVHPDPDVAYFRSRHCALKEDQKSLLRDLALISGFKATSDLPRWLNVADRIELHKFLELQPQVERLGRTRFNLDGREVRYDAALPLPRSFFIPTWLAEFLGLCKMAVHEVLPAMFAARKKR